MGDQYSGDEVRWYWLGCQSGCSVSFTMYSSHTMGVNSCATTFMIIFECQQILLGMCRI